MKSEGQKVHFNVADLTNAACKMQLEHGIELVWVRFDKENPYPAIYPWHSPEAELHLLNFAAIINQRLDLRESFRLASQARAAQESEALPNFLRVAS